MNTQQAGGSFDYRKHPRLEPFAVFVEGKPVIGVYLLRDEDSSREWRWTLPADELVVKRED